MIRDGQCDPVLSEVWPQTEDDMAGFDEGIKDPELGLEMCSIAEDVEVLLVSECHLEVRSGVF